MRLSFRDPDGFVYRYGDRVLRCVYPHAAEGVRRFLESPLAIKASARGRLCASAILTDAQAGELPPVLRECTGSGGLILEHQPIPFVSYPYEWAPEMLYAAAEWTLELAQTALDSGFRLKDATPYNIMFDGARPVFIDVLSFEQRNPTEALWRPYAQFMRTFFYPLLASRYFGLQIDEMLLAHRDGIVPDRLVRLCPAWRLMLPPFLGAVTIPYLLSRGRSTESAADYRTRTARDPAEGRFLLEAVFRRAHKLLRSVRPRQSRGDGVHYADSGHTYANPEMAAKEQFVDETLAAIRPRNVLDAGCNTGRFSRIAARYAGCVVAIDRDPEVVGALWKNASASHSDILPLVVDLCRPPGACGWANRELPSFLDRARGKFECVLMLALVHHLSVSERVPLEAIFGLAAELSTRHLVVEYVDPSDSQFQRILRGREALHRDFTVAAFEEAARPHFEIANARQLTATRRIYWLRKAS